MSEINLEEVVARAKNGDRTAVDELYRNYSEPLLRFVMKLGLREFDAQDVVSETFVSMMEHIGQLSNNAQFGTWLHTIAKRKAMEFSEKNARHQRISFDAENSENSGLEKISGDAAAVDLAFEEAYGDTVMLPQDYAENEEIKQIIAEQINALSPEHKETIFLFYYQDKSIAEIAELTGTNQNNVKARLFHARKNLKKKLEELQKKGVVLCAVPFRQLLPQYSELFKRTAAAGAASAAGAAAASASGAAGAAAAGGIALKLAAIAAAAAAAAGIGVFVWKNARSETDNSASVSSVQDVFYQSAYEYLPSSMEDSAKTSSYAAVETTKETTTEPVYTETEPQPAIPASPDDLTGWQKAYYDYIGSFTSTHSEYQYVAFSLTDTDGNGTPELLVDVYKEKTSFGALFGQQAVLVAYTGSGTTELLCADETDPNSSVKGGFTFTGSTPVISMIVPSDIFAQAVEYTEYFYRLEDGVFTRLPENDSVTVGVYGYNYVFNGANTDEAVYRSKREALFGSTKLISTWNSDTQAERAESTWFSASDAFQNLVSYEK